MSQRVASIKRVNELARREQGGILGAIAGIRNQIEEYPGFKDLKDILSTTEGRLAKVNRLIQLTDTTGFTPECHSLSGAFFLSSDDLELLALTDEEFRSLWV